MPVDHIVSELEGRRCEVYFFASWSTYSHPVTPVDPMYLERALMRKAFYRAWSCGEGSGKRFALFEAVSNKLVPLRAEPPATTAGTDLEGPLFFELVEAPTGLVLGSPIKAAAAMQRGTFGLRFEKGSTGAWSVRQSLIYSYRYHYRPDGALAKVTFTDTDGKVSELVY